MSTQLTRRQLLAGASLAATAAATTPKLTGCGGSSPKSPSGPASPGSVAPSPAKTAARSGALDEKALRRKVASLLVVGFRGSAVHAGDWIMRAVRDQGIGGVILFDTDQLTG